MVTRQDCANLADASYGGTVSPGWSQVVQSENGFFAAIYKQDGTGAKTLLQMLRASLFFRKLFAIEKETMAMSR